MTAKNNSDHLHLHKVMAADAACPQRLVSRRPFSRQAARLPNDNYDPAKAWSDRVDSGPPVIQAACPQPRPVLPPGADLTLEQWVKLSRLRCGIARVGDTLKLVVVIKIRPCVPADISHSQCSMWSLTACYTRLMMALLVFAAQMQQLGLGWKT